MLPTPNPSVASGNKSAQGPTVQLHIATSSGSRENDERNPGWFRSILINATQTVSLTQTANRHSRNRTGKHAQTTRTRLTMRQPWVSRSPRTKNPQKSKLSLQKSKLFVAALRPAEWHWWDDSVDWAAMARRDENLQKTTRKNTRRDQHNYLPPLAQHAPNVQDSTVAEANSAVADINACFVLW